MSQIMTNNKAISQWMAKLLAALEIVLLQLIKRIKTNQSEALHVKTAIENLWNNLWKKLPTMKTKYKLKLERWQKLFPEIKNDKNMFSKCKITWLHLLSQCLSLDWMLRIVMDHNKIKSTVVQRLADHKTSDLNKMTHSWYQCQECLNKTTLLLAQIAMPVVLLTRIMMI